MDMTNKNMLQELSFDKIEDGIYGKPIVPRKALYFSNNIGETRSYSSEESLAKASYSHDAAKVFSVLSEGALDLQQKTEKPADVLKLEDILSKSYSNKELRITRVRTLPPTRKESVKEVSFTLNDGLVYKVWVFKADPKETIRELNIYYIAHKAGVPTGKPIAYNPVPVGEEYPYEVAILGGILNHAGEPYKSLLENLQLEPELIYKTAVSIAKMIAGYHIKLTLAKKEFKKYGVDIPIFGVEKEIKNRFLVTFGLSGRGVSERRLISDMNYLNNECQSSLVVSHNDIRGENIVTLLGENDFVGQSGPSYEKFGVIDWAEIAWDNPYGDLIDFWLHHKRFAESISNSYDFAFTGIESAYEEEFNRLGKNLGLVVDTSQLQTESRIKSAIWNLLEMYDPVRNNPIDIQKKAERHCKAFFEDVDYLKTNGYPEQAARIDDSVRNILHDSDHLRPFIL